MSVSLFPPQASDLHSVLGIDIGWTQAGIRKPNRKDMVLIRIAPGSEVAAVFTQNRFCAAPVVVAKEHLGSGSEIVALIINTGNANAGTGADGLLHARQTCERVAKYFGCDANQVLPFSTGVILEPLPIARVLAGVAGTVESLRPDNWLNAAQGIMTTDTVPKAASRTLRLGAHEVHITGIAKGAGMIHPNMATMLGFIATDAEIAPELLRRWVKELADDSFNRICVDGDTSTNDSFILIATGRSAAADIVDDEHPDAKLLKKALLEVAQQLAQSIVRDGEGATKFVTVHIDGGRTREECRKTGFAIAKSPLVKTAFFASDPNLGRILAAVGYAGIDDLEMSQVKLYIGDLLVSEGGAIAAGYSEEKAAAVMRASEFDVRVDLGRGQVQDTFWTCDFSHEYVTINADYRT